MAAELELERAGMDFLDVSGTIPGSPVSGCIEQGTYDQGLEEVHGRGDQEACEGASHRGVARGHLADMHWCRQGKSR